MVLSPLNSIVEDTLMEVVQKECKVGTWDKARNKQSKLHMLFRFDILCRMLDILGEFGSTPKFSNQKHVMKLINSKEFGKKATSGGRNSGVIVTGFTAAFFLTLPELFTQWKEQKDGDVSNEQPYKILDFIGQQCHWPTFSNDKTKRMQANKQVKGPGSMLSNAASGKKLYSFLPEKFDLMTLFKDCLAGEILWQTVSLCEETKKIQPPSRKPATQSPTKQATKKKRAKQDAEPAPAPKESTSDIEEDESFEEKQEEKKDSTSDDDEDQIGQDEKEEQEDEQEGEEQKEEEEQDEEEEQEEEQEDKKRAASPASPRVPEEEQEDKKRAASPPSPRVPRKKKKTSEGVASQAEQVAEGVAEGIALAPKIASDDLNLNGEDITAEVEALFYALEKHQDLIKQDLELQKCFNGLAKWKNGFIYAYAQSENDSDGKDSK